MSWRRAGPILLTSALLLAGCGEDPDTPPGSVGHSLAIREMIDAAVAWTANPCPAPQGVASDV